MGRIGWIAVSALIMAASAMQASAQTLPSESSSKSGSIFGGQGPAGRNTPAPSVSPLRPESDYRGANPALDPRTGPGSSPSPGSGYGDTVQKQNDEAKRQREMIVR